jgi:pyruvate carboxylase
MAAWVTPAAVITPFYDSCWSRSPSGRDFNLALQRMDRALREFRIRGVKTNIPFLENVIANPVFRSGQATTTLIDTTPDCFNSSRAATAPPSCWPFWAMSSSTAIPQAKGTGLKAALPQ